MGWLYMKKKAMKKRLILICFIIIIFTSCSKEYVPNEQNEPANYSDNTYNQNQSFFFPDTKEGISYNATFSIGEGFIDEIIQCQVISIGNYVKGELFEIKFDNINDDLDSRLNLGYFYVEDDAIYKIEKTEENIKILKEENKLPTDNILVCKNDSVKDVLSENEKGQHHYITANGNTIEFHSYNNQTETGYYENMSWEKNKGMIFYKSGYGAGRDSIELNIAKE